MISTAARMCAIVVASAVGVGLVGCAPSTTASVETAMEQAHASVGQNSIEGLRTPGTLTVGLKNSSTAPLVIENETGVKGLEVELACALADELGLNVAFVRTVDPKEALVDSCDVVMDVGGTSDGYAVVGDIANSAVALFHKGPTEVATVDQIRGKSIALQEGSASQQLLRTTDLNAKEVPTETLDNAFRALEAGSVDYVLCHPMSGAYLAERYDNLSFAGTLNEPTSTGIAIAPGDGPVPSAVRDAYAKLEESGILDETRRRWLGDMPHLDATTMVADVPMHQTEGKPLELDYDAERVGTGKMDGSSAGANAAVISTLSQESTNPGTTQTEDVGMYEVD